MNRRSPLHPRPSPYIPVPVPSWLGPNNFGWCEGCVGGSQQIINDILIASVERKIILVHLHFVNENETVRFAVGVHDVRRLLRKARAEGLHNGANILHGQAGDY